MWWLSLGATAAQIQIVTPAPGATVASGAPLAIEVRGSSDVARIVVVVAQPDGPSVIADATGSTAALSVTVPRAAVGQQNVVASGIDASGELVTVSAPLAVTAVPPAALTRIAVYPAEVYLEPGRSAPLSVTGHYADGVDRDLSVQPGLTLKFRSSAASQAGPATVRLDLDGDDSVVVGFGGLVSPAVPIKRLPR